MMMMITMMAHTYSTKEEDHAAEWKTTGITKVTWKYKYSEARQYAVTELCQSTCCFTCIQAWIPATIKACAKKSAVSYRSSQKLISADRAYQTEILTRSTWFSYWNNTFALRKSHLPLLCLFIGLTYCFLWEQNVLLKCLNVCSVIWTVHSTGSNVHAVGWWNPLSWGEERDEIDWSRNDRLTQLFH